MKVYRRLCYAIALVFLAIEIGRIHTHLHVIECALRGQISDSDYSRWDKGDGICKQLEAQ